MSLLHQKSWSGKNLPHWVVIVRIVLGICLIYKGIDFIQHKDQLEVYFANTKALKNLTWTVSFLPWVHIIGGFMILIGFFTRFMCLVQMPIILGAVVFVNIKSGVEGVKGSESELPFSFLMLVLVIVFFVEGGGFMSLDNYIRKPLHPEEEEEEEEEFA